MSFEWAEVGHDAVEKVRQSCSLASFHGISPSYTPLLSQLILRLTFA